MNLLNTVVELAKAGAILNINPHRNHYTSAKQYMDDLISLDATSIEEIGQDVYDEIIKRDALMELHVYPDTPNGFFKIIHYDMEKVLELALEDK